MLPPSRRREHRPSTSSVRRCWWISEMSRFRCFRWMRISCRVPPSWQSSRISSSRVSLSTSHSILNSSFTKIPKCSNKWKFWKLNLRNMLRLKMSWPSVLISAIEWSKSIRLKSRCFKKKSQNARTPSRLQSESLSVWTSTSQTSPNSSKRESLTTNGSSRVLRTNWMRSLENTKSWLTR